MPDITMCASKTCPLREDCYRSRAKPSERQSYSVFRWQPVDDDTLDAHCARFVWIRAGDVLARPDDT